MEVEMDTNTKPVEPTATRTDTYATMENNAFYEDLAVLAIGQRTQLDYLAFHTNLDSRVYVFDRSEKDDVYATRRTIGSEEQYGPFVLIAMGRRGERIRTFMCGNSEIEKIISEFEQMEPYPTPPGAN